MSAVADFRQMVAVTDHRDAGLLDLIERCTTLMQHSYRCIDRANRYKEDGRVYRRFWKEALSTGEEQRQLERQICATKAHTPLGAIAKGQLWLETHYDNTGTMNDLPRAAIREMMAMLEEARA